MKLLLSAFGLFVCGCGSSGAREVRTASAKTYPVQLHRPLRVGDRNHVTFTLERTSVTRGWKTSAPDAVEKATDTSRLSFDATEVVLSVDENGDGLAVTYEKAHLTRTEKGGQTTLLRMNQVDLTRAVSDERAHLSVDGAAPKPEVEEALEAILTIRSGGPTDDVVWGSPLPEEVGSHWPVRPERWISWVFGDGAKEIAVHGETTLESFVDQNGGCLDVHAAIEVEGLPSVTSGGVLFDVTKKKLDHRWVVPVDPSLGVVRRETLDEYDLKSHEPTDHGLVFEVAHTSRWQFDVSSDAD